MTKKPATPRKTAAPKTVTGRAASFQGVEINTDGYIKGFAVQPVLTASLSRTQALFISSIPSESADLLLVGSMSDQIYAKMVDNRAAGKYGWHTENCTSDQLRVDLKKLVEKEDWIDVAIVSSMLLLREQLGLK